MSDYDSDYDYEEKPRINILALILNILTGAMVLITICVGVYFLIVFANPQTSLNPFPPPPLPTLAPPPSPSPVAAQQLPPTRTPIPTTPVPEPTASRTSIPTVLPSPTVTQFVLISLTPVPVTEELDTSGASFEVKGDPLAMPNFARQDMGCDFLGVAGHVFDMSGNVITQGIVINLEGTLAGQFYSELSITGVTNLYGPGGFEFILADRPITSANTLSIQLLDQSGEFALSEKVFFETFEDCEKNLILIDFQQFR